MHVVVGARISLFGTLYYSHNLYPHFPPFSSTTTVLSDCQYQTIKVSQANSQKFHSNVMHKSFYHIYEKNGTFHLIVLQLSYNCVVYTTGGNSEGPNYSTPVTHLQFKTSPKSKAQLAILVVTSNSENSKVLVISYRVCESFINQIFSRLLCKSTSV